MLFQIEWKLFGGQCGKEMAFFKNRPNLMEGDVGRCDAEEGRRAIDQTDSVKITPNWPHITPIACEREQNHSQNSSYSLIPKREAL